MVLAVRQPESLENNYKLQIFETSRLVTEAEQRREQHEAGSVEVGHVADAPLSQSIRIEFQNKPSRSAKCNNTLQ